MSPVPCGNVTVYCPEGASTPQFVQAGFYPLGSSVASMTGQLACPSGHYCFGGIRTVCPSGTYRDGTGASTVGDCAVCPAGFFCGECWCTFL